MMTSTQTGYFAFEPKLCTSLKDRGLTTGQYDRPSRVMPVPTASGAAVTVRFESRFCGSRVVAFIPTY